MPIPPNSPLDNLRIVLCRPQLGENVGAVCRAMKSMGIRHLTLVAGQRVDLERAAVTAVHATDVLEGRQTSMSLAEAVADCALVAGITRRAGRWRKYSQLTPEDLAGRAAIAAAAPVAVVFGNEASGLSDAELRECHVSVRIPSSELFPSLNLSHAVQVIAYALYQRLSPSPLLPVSPVSTRRLEEVSLAAANAMREAGFFTQIEDGEMRIFFRDILARSGLAEAEADRLQSILTKMRDMIGHLRRGAASRGFP